MTMLQIQGMEAIGEGLETRSNGAIDARVLAEGLRRRRRLWGTTCLLGLLIGLALPSLVAHKYSAVSRLYLVEPADRDATVAMATDVSLLETDTVATRAMAALGQGGSVSSFLSTYKGTAQSSAILSIQLSAKSENEAIRRDAAVAKAFLEVRTALQNQQTKSVITALNGQIADVNAEINRQTEAINNSGSGSNAALQAANLIASRSQLITQVTQFQAQIQQDQLSSVSVNAGSIVLDQAAVVTPSTKKTLVKDGSSGLLGGLVIGWIIVLVETCTSDRLYRRREVALALGAPVVLSLGRYRPARMFKRRRLARRSAHPTGIVTAVANRLQKQLDQSQSSVLAVVAIGTEELSALAIGQLARSIAASGPTERGGPTSSVNWSSQTAPGVRGVALVDYSTGRLLKRVVAGRERGSVRVVSASTDLAQPTTRPSDTEVTIVLAPLDPALGAEYLTAWTTEAVVVITAFGATRDRVNAIRSMLSHAKVAVSWAILVDTDQRDQTFGAPLESAPDRGLDLMDEACLPNW